MAEDLIQNYIDRATFASDTQFGLEQIALLEAAYTKLRESRANFLGSPSTKDVSGGTAATTAAIKDLTAAIATQTTTVTQNTQANKQQAASQKEVSDSAQKLAAEKTKLSQLGSDEAKQLAQASANVAKHYNVLIDPKTADWANLIMVLGMIYGTRLMAIRVRRTTERRENPQPEKPQGDATIYPPNMEHYSGETY